MIKKSTAYFGYKGFTYRGTRAILLLAVKVLFVYLCYHSIWLIGGWLIGINIWSIHDMRNDKNRSKMTQEHSRVPDKQFFAEAILGGWIGILIAKTLLKHKTSTKTKDFRSILYGCIAINILLCILFYYVNLTLFFVLFIIFTILFCLFAQK